MNPFNLLKKDPNHPRLTRGERIDTVLRGLTASFFVVTPIVSALYFMITQMRLSFIYPKGNNDVFASLYLGDVWDRLPIHIDNLLHYGLFARLGSTVAPHTWVTIRHDTRNVGIGIGVAVIIGVITIGIKERKRASTRYMVWSVPFAVVLALVTTVVMSLFFIHVTPFIEHWGISTNNSWLQAIAKGSFQATVTGVIAGFVGKLPLRRTFYTLQLMSLERKIAKGRTERFWWRFVYPPTYRKRFHKLVAEGNKGELRTGWVGIVLSLSAPVALALCVIGVWVLHFGPAAGH